MSIFGNTCFQSDPVRLTQSMIIYNIVYSDFPNKYVFCRFLRIRWRIRNHTSSKRGSLRNLSMMQILQIFNLPSRNSWELESTLDRPWFMSNFQILFSRILWFITPERLTVLSLADSRLQHRTVLGKAPSAATHRKGEWREQVPQVRHLHYNTKMLLRRRFPWLGVTLMKTVTLM